MAIHKNDYACKKCGHDNDFEFELLDDDFANCKTYYEDFTCDKCGKINELEIREFVTKTDIEVNGINLK